MLARTGCKRFRAETCGRAAGERVAKTQARVERHIAVATRLAQPGVGHYEAPSMRLARRRAAKVEPALAKEVQHVLSERASLLAAERRGQEAVQTRDARRSLSR